jgi:hypothetical protein
MANFSILKVDDEYTLKQYPTVGLRLDPLSVLPHQSGVTTSPLDGVSVRVKYLITGILLNNFQLIRMNITSSHELVVILDCSGDIGLSSSLYPVKG